MVYLYPLILLLPLGYSPVPVQISVAPLVARQKAASNPHPTGVSRNSTIGQKGTVVPGSPTRDTGSPIAVVAEAGVKIEEGYPAQAVYSFGKVSLLDAPVVEKVFILRNVSPRTITIGRIQGSCGCLSAVLAPKQGGAAPIGVGLATLKPGATVAVRTTVNLEVLYPGELSKAVYVYTDDRLDNPALRIDLTGTLVPTVTFEPTTLSFGSITAGSPKSIVLTIRPDPRLVAAGGPPPLLPTTPGIKATLLPVSNSDKGTAPSPQPDKWRYEIAVGEGTPLGVLNGYLSFAPETTNGSDLAAVRAWRAARVFVVAAIIGDVSASPPYAVFGLVPLKPAGTKSPASGSTPEPLAKVTIRLLPVKPNVLVGATAQCDNPFVSTEIVRVKESGAEVGVLSLVLRRGVEPGVLQTRVTVRLTNGQELIIPVTAFVQQQ